MVKFIFNFLIFVGALGLTAQVVIGFSFFISSIYEKEKRATIFGFLQFLGMLLALVIFVMLAGTGFFHTGWGRTFLILGYIVAGVAAFFLLRRTEPNQRALQGSKGLIIGDVERFDERTHVFARNRSLRPGSPEFEAFYREHPEFEAFDAKRRKKGGPVGKVGTIDRPHGDALVAMTLAGQKMCEYLSSPKIYEPEPHFSLKAKLKEKKTELTSLIHSGSIPIAERFLMKTGRTGARRSL
jgi:hypothetical protein